MHIRTGGGIIEYRDDGSGDMSGGGCNACGCYQLTEYNWKEAYGKPGGLAACLPPTIFLLLRLLFFVAWFGTNTYAVYQLVTVYSFPMQYYLTKLTSWSALLRVALGGRGLRAIRSHNRHLAVVGCVGNHAKQRRGVANRSAATGEERGDRCRCLVHRTGTFGERVNQPTWRQSARRSSRGRAGPAA